MNSKYFECSKLHSPSDRRLSVMIWLSGGHPEFITPKAYNILKSHLKRRSKLHFHNLASVLIMKAIYVISKLSRAQTPDKNN